MSRLAYPKIAFGCPIWCLMVSIVCFLCPIGGYADTYARECRPPLLSIHSAMVQHWMPPRPKFELVAANRSISGPMVSTPEPYSYLMATFGVFGLLTMGTLFRKRKNRQQPTERSTSRRSRKIKHAKRRISLTGRMR